VALLLGACSVPFTRTTEPRTVTLPTTAGAYGEETVDIPEDALRDDVTFETVMLHYTVTKTGTAFTADVDLYATPETEADNTKDGDGEVLLRVTLSDSEASKSGNTESDVILEVLNNKQSSMVVGAEAFALTLAVDEAVEIQYYLEVSGEPPRDLRRPV
jgi:hypothetical protein